MSTLAAPESAPAVAPPVAAPVAAPVVVPEAAVAPVAPVVEAKLDPSKVEAPAADGKPVVPVEAAPVELKYPDGFKGDPAALEAFKPVFKELGLDGAKAQKLVDFFAKTADAQSKAVEAQQKKWVNEIANDPALGGDKLAASTATVQQGVLWAGGKELAAEINRLGIGDHPALARAFFKIGQSLKDDSVANTVNGQPPMALDANEKFQRQLFNHPSSQKLGFGG